MFGLIAATLLATPLGEAGADARPAYTLGPELQVGAGAPMGLASLSAVYGPRDWLSLGGGLGLGDGDDVSYGLFARAHVLRLGPFKLGASLTASRADERQRSEFRDGDYVTWSWRPAYRLDVGLGVEARRGRWSARLEGGAGYALNEPDCAYSSTNPVSPPPFVGPCRSAEVPPQYQSPPTLGGTVPTWFALSVGVDLQPAPQLPASGIEGTAPPRIWYGAPAVWADLASVALVGLAVHHDSEALGAVAGATYLLGGPINHRARGHGRRALGSFGLRAAGGATTLLAIVPLVFCIAGEGNNDCDAWGLLLPIGPLAAMIVDDVVLSRER